MFTSMNHAHPQNLGGGANGPWPFDGENPAAGSVTSQTGHKYKMESVSRVAIRNIKPPDVDPNDPDQKKLIEKLNPVEAKIWNYSGNKPSFLAKLSKNNPAFQRKAIESIVQFKHGDGGRICEGDEDDIDEKVLEVRNDDTENNMLQASSKRLPQIKMSVQISPSQDQDSYDISDSTTASLVPVYPHADKKMIIKKTVELVNDMRKSTEFTFHALRATARFLTYPTPSVPSDNYLFGHIKGWLWLIYKGLSNINLQRTSISNSDPQALVQILRQEMTRLKSKTRQICSTQSQFHRDLKALNDKLKKEAKFLKAHSVMWSTRMDVYFKNVAEMKDNLLLNIKEDHPFSSDWVFHPHPSQASIQHNFFHFQWIKGKKHWETSDFEVRSDYSTRWHPFTSFSPEMQVEIVTRLIDHLSAILNEANVFVYINLRLSFDIDEIKCLRFAVAEINSVRKNEPVAAYIADMTKRLFEDMATLEQVSSEFCVHLDEFDACIEPCYDTLSTKTPLLPLDDRDASASLNCRRCRCGKKSSEDFITLYGPPMQAVLLRTPISEEVVARFFPQEYIVHETNVVAASHSINLYGLSEGYVPSLFDSEIGRDPPTRVPKRLPKMRRKNNNSAASNASPLTFNFGTMNELCAKVVKEESGELDTETYLQLFDEVKKFLQSFGTIFNFLLIDLTERLENLENRLYTQLSEHYESLEKMVEHEKASGIIERDPLTCGTRAFQRVHAAFAFFTQFVKNLTELEAEDAASSYAVKTAYYSTYSKYHSWFTQKTSMFSMYAIPNKIGVYAKLLPGKPTTEIDSALKKFLEVAKKTCDHCEGVFRKKEVADL